MVKRFSIRKYFLFSITTIVFGLTKAFAQHPKFDKLEQWYDQGLYKIVYRKSDKLLKNSEYDFSKLPAYYKALASIQRAQNPFWFKNNEHEVMESFEFLIELKKEEKGKMLLKSHNQELVELKFSIDSWLTDLKLRNKEDIYASVLSFNNLLMKEVDFSKQTESPRINKAEYNSKKSKTLLTEAEKHLGVKYVYGGKDPSGFDCSGFTMFVFKKQNIQLPRIAKDQYAFSKKIKKSEVKEGDLVFFTHGGPIAHVGIIYDIKGEEIFMIHASSSKGIQIISLTQSKYWSSRIYGFGSVL